MYDFQRQRSDERTYSSVSRTLKGEVFLTKVSSMIFLSVKYDKEENDSYSPDYEQNVIFGYLNDDDETLQETSFFDNANELERETPSKIPQRVTFYTDNNRRSPFPRRVWVFQ
ncbi:8701_t:CDS:2 [Funneliformis caledonium]|uniref:8701_t:CDS:1 n=1 Tax=Funneliformis caledonium TaxID=1117310 RepID=A0A9N9FN13_9GLOM|nr:8701_t:CDS:2 [Funneliformis caledonium]